jgi:hypothetical protein
VTAATADCREGWSELRAARNISAIDASVCLGRVSGWVDLTSATIDGAIWTPVTQQLGTPCSDPISQDEVMPGCACSGQQLCVGVFPSQHASAGNPATSRPVHTSSARAKRLRNSMSIEQVARLVRSRGVWHAIN